MADLEHPAVTAAREGGYPIPESPRSVCPVCGAETWDVYRADTGGCCGCPACVSLVDIEELRKEVSHA